MAVNMYDKPVESAFIPLPMQQLFAAGDAMRQAEETASDLSLDLLDKYNVGALQADTSNRDAKIKELELELDQVAEQYKQNPMVALSKVKHLRRKVNQELTRGELAYIQANYNAAQKYKESVKDMIKAGLSPAEADYFVQNSIAGFGGTQYDPKTGDYKSFNGAQPVKQLDENKWLRDNLKTIEADETTILRGLTQSEREAIKLNGLESALREGKISEVGVKKIYNNLALIAEGDLTLRQSLEQKGQFLGFQNAGEILLRNEDGSIQTDENGFYKLANTPFAAQLAGIANAGAYRKVDLKTQIRENKQAAIDAGLDGTDQVIDLLSREFGGVGKDTKHMKPMAVQTVQNIATEKNPDGSYRLSKDSLKALFDDGGRGYYGGVIDGEGAIGDMSSAAGLQRVRDGQSLWQTLGGTAEIVDAAEVDGAGGAFSISSWLGEVAADILTDGPKEVKLSGQVSFGGKTYTADEYLDFLEMYARETAGSLIQQKQIEKLEETESLMVPYSVQTWTTVPQVSETVADMLNTNAEMYQLYMVNPSSKVNTTTNSKNAIVQKMEVPNSGAAYYVPKHLATAQMPTMDGVQPMAFFDMYIQHDGLADDKNGDADSYMGRTPIKTVRGSDLGFKDERANKVFYAYQVGFPTTSENVSEEMKLVINNSINIKQGKVENQDFGATRSMHSYDMELARQDRTLNTGPQVKPGQSFKLNYIDMKTGATETMPLYEITNLGPDRWLFDDGTGNPKELSLTQLEQVILPTARANKHNLQLEGK